MTVGYEEDPTTGFFNCWSGRHPVTAVRSLDLYLAWRDGAPLPPLASFPALAHVSVPIQLCDTEFIAELARLPRVRSLHVFHGQDDPVPEALFTLTHLEWLDLSGNEATSLPDRFTELPMLRALSLAHNELSIVPPSVFELRELRELHLQGNQLATLSAVHAPLTALDVSGNPLGSLPELPPTLEVLGAMCETLAPPPVAHLTALRELSLLVTAGGAPAALASLPTLTSLQLGGPELDEGLFAVLPTQLEALHCMRCPQLVRVPQTIERLRRLSRLDISLQPVVELAAELANIPLDTLAASLTRLADTPTYAHLPSTLRVLHLGNCGMTRVPERIRELPRLEQLSLGFNPLVERPAWLARIPNVQF